MVATVTSLRHRILRFQIVPGLNWGPCPVRRPSLLDNQFEEYIFAMISAVLVKSLDTTIASIH